MSTLPMRSRRFGLSVTLIALLTAFSPPRGAPEALAKPDLDQTIVTARVVALGIPGAAAISPVGTFLPGGPIHDNPRFAAFTQPGRVLDPTRLLVGSTSNFGAPLANRDQQPGALLSIDPRGPDPLLVPAGFAASDGQASTLSGRVQLFSAQSPAFVNAIHSPSAVTARFTGVSNPTGLSINNAFGRLWPANAPFGLPGIGTSTILDPSGEPLAGAPNAQAGGVFAGQLTPRLPTQLLPGGLTSGAVGTAFLGRSPDGSGKAVFAVVLADGSLVQVHAAQAVDGLAPAGTVSPLRGQQWAPGQHGDCKPRRDDDCQPDPDAEPGSIALRAGHAWTSAKSDGGDSAPPRLGVLLNYAPSRVLYVSEPYDNAIAALDLADDGRIFRVARVRTLRSPALNQPIDLAPAMTETTAPSWASNTTLDVQADLYVANRGDGTILRLRQDGTLVARREILLAGGLGLGTLSLNGIAGSPDGRTLWATAAVQLLGLDTLTGAVLELPAF